MRRVAAVCGAGLVAVAVQVQAPGVAGASAGTRGACSATVWTAGADRYHTYRIPAVVAVRGTLVAFAEARRHSASDDGDIAVVERRSFDGGCTWSRQTVVGADSPATIGNPAPVVTRSGRLVLLTNRQGADATQAKIQAGQIAPEDGRRVFVQTSDDAGATWTPRREITPAVKHPDWRWYGTGPGHALRLDRGPAAGRLVVAVAHTGPGGVSGAHLLLSDDDGRTWRIGANDEHTDGRVAPAETSAAQLPDGRLYLSSRDERGSDPGNRLFTYSTDGGRSYTAPYRSLPNLVTPVVEGSVLQMPGPAGSPCAPLLYSGPDDPSLRRHMTVRRSTDGGRTWQPLAELTSPTTAAAYSDLVPVPRAGVGVLYETGTTGPYQRIDFRTVPLGCARR
ncbi:sialidase family protein [Actinacidiphila acididurans]|uniref:exo-alpha-sialidase n=1 Tax=Actinacidiphila acididurans TaxID=2784346 RepID=A0ABS2TWC5_9ACTN|nr:sialidase family protein [Actinacidiphila acididurans]MBM9507640.1 exo-alpha-sialidase [Actinacidiphila acididurans]